MPGTRLLVTTSQTLTMGGHLPNLGHAATAASFEPARSPLRIDQLIEYGEAVGRHHDIYDDNGQADLDQLVITLGGRVEQQTDISIQLLVFGAGDFVISTAPYESDRRRRRRTAEALGSYFVHYLQPDLRGGRLLRHRYDKRAAFQARCFAMGLLTPAEEFAEAWAALDGDSRAVGDRFDIAPASAGDRAAVLGLHAREG